ncbi:MAG: HepT-like ribonuclease domain-containing protein [Burkholderiales bacterium]
MRPEARKYLFDIRLAADSIAAFCSGKSFEDYRRDEMLKAAVERKFAVVGEALSKLANADPATAARIPEHRRIIAFRNIIIHGYANVDDKIVWGVVEADLAALHSAVAELLANN